MYIGKLAKLCGVSTKTIRHYELIGLLPAAKRKGNYRVFTERDLQLVLLIKQSQELGFQLSEIQQAIAANNQGIPWQVIYQLIEQKLQTIEQKIKQLKDARKRLKGQQQAIINCLNNNPDCKSPLS